VGYIFKCAILATYIFIYGFEIYIWIYIKVQITDNICLFTSQKGYLLHSKCLKYKADYNSSTYKQHFKSVTFG
jgi:hypothetical protein